jgi:5-hydroxyisourate hydrolase-like protein (transthyretin family)
MTVRSKRHVLPGLILAVLSAMPAPASESVTVPNILKERQMTQHSYVGMWSTDDGRVRHELLPDGRYDEARGSRQSAYQGRYEVTGTHIEYWDDTGFTADGDFVDKNTLHHGGMILRRQ